MRNTGRNSIHDLQIKNGPREINDRDHVEMHGPFIMLLFQPYSFVNGILSVIKFCIVHLFYGLCLRKCIKTDRKLCAI